MTALSESTSGARLVACVGPGGVGKTTVAAALGVAAARRGERVFVLTIDPAKRLADALGIGLSDKAVRVPLERTAADVGSHGCVGGVGPLLGVHELRERGLLGPGQVLATAAVAGGVVWHAALWRC